MNFLSRVADYVTLSLLWVLCSLPIVTLGASTAALDRIMLNEREDKQTNCAAFFAAFRSNFKKATILWLILLAAGALLILCLWALGRLPETAGKAVDILLHAGVLLLFLVWMFGMVHTFPMTSYFENTVGGILRNSLLVSLLSPLRTLGCMILMLLPFPLAFFAADIFLYTLPLWICLWPGAAAYISGGWLLKIYRKFLIPKTGGGE